MEKQMSLFDRLAQECWLMFHKEAVLVEKSELKKPLPLEPKFFGSDYVPKEDDKRLTGNIQKVFDLMKDGNWRTLQEIERETRVPAASVSANLRHLKRDVYGSHNLTKRIRGERSGGLWEYKIVW